MQKLSKLNAHIRRWGWWRTFYWVLMRVAARFLGIEVFVARVRDTERTPTENPCTLAGVTFREASVEEMLACAEDPGNPLATAFVNSAFGRGDLAYGAFRDGALVAYLWRSMNTAPHNIHCWVKVASPYSYSYNSFANPELRGQRIVPGLLLYSDEALLQKGYTHRVGIIATTNYASLAMGKRLGSEVIGRVAYVRWFGRIRFFRSRSIRDIGFELVEPPPRTQA